jgi:hypothetical protein
MSRYLILLLLICAIIWMMRGERRAALKRRQAKAPAAPPLVSGEQMVACAQCDLHLPVSDAISVGGSEDEGQRRLWFCCDAHRVLFENGIRRHDPSLYR